VCFPVSDIDRAKAFYSGSSEAAVRGGL
jgi:catechol 2,3-dioxygenase-like lactoylglutathione lyase family enzyme